jgi:CheY-like chemotaxis protein
MAERDVSSPVVMVVEDFDDTRLLMKRLLEMSGCRVVEAVNGREAVERAASERPQLILMDLNMPVLDGFTAALRIRERAETRAVPIVAVTAYDTVESRRAARAVGCDDYVAKPLDLDEITNIVRRHLETADRRDQPLPT